MPPTNDHLAEVAAAREDLRRAKTRQDDAIKAAYLAGHDLRPIADAMGVSSTNSVASILERLGVKRRDPHRYTAKPEPQEAQP